MGIAFLTTFGGIFATLPAQAQTPVSEYQVKAAYLFNFVKYVTWPEERFATTNAPIVIGILGDDPFGPPLDEMLANKAISGRKLEVQRATSTEKLKNAHIIFISRSEEKRLEKNLEKLKKISVLTVSDIDHFSRRGGMIGFVLVSQSVRFEIDLAAAEEASLKVSGRLLSAATMVHPERTQLEKTSSK